LYEVVFRTISPTGAALPTQVKQYYRGAGTKSDGYINVAVYPGYAYDVLLLAGSTAHQNKTLLAAGFSPGSYTTPSPEGTNLIKTGENNVIAISIKAFPPVWNTASGNAINRTTGSENDFAFTVTGLLNSATSIMGSRYFHIAPELSSNAASPEATVPNTTTLTVQFNVVPLAALFAAEDGGSDEGAISLIPNVKLNPFSGQPPYGFTPVNFKPSLGTAAASDSELLGAASGDYIKYAIPASSSQTTNLFISFTNDTSSGTTNKLPKNNTEGLLIFELGYRAFGAAATVPSAENFFLWTIRNGLNEGEDTAAADLTDTTGDTDGGSFRIKFGAGAPVKLVNTETNHHAGNW
jgi:hypothetical protein